jgi:hypothetical protein
MRRKVVVAAIVLLVAFSLTAGLLLECLDVGKNQSNLFTYPFSVKDKVFVVSVETNWDAKQAPSVTLLNSSNSVRHAIELYFLGETEEKTISYNITFPCDLLWGNVSLIWKYSTVDPDRYDLVNNGTHTSLEMTFEYKPFFSGIGYFVILGSEGAW